MNDAGSLHDSIKNNFQESNSETKSSSISVNSSDKSDTMSIPPLKRCDNSSTSSSIGGSTTDSNLSAGNAPSDSDAPSVIFEPDDNLSDVSHSFSKTSIPRLIFKDESTTSSHTSDLLVAID